MSYRNTYRDPLRQYLRQQTELLDFEQAWKLLRTVAEAAAAVPEKRTGVSDSGHGFRIGA